MLHVYNIPVTDRAIRRLSATRMTSLEWVNIDIVKETSKEDVIQKSYEMVQRHVEDSAISESRLCLDRPDGEGTIRMMLRQGRWQLGRMQYYGVGCVSDDYRTSLVYINGNLTV